MTKPTSKKSTDGFTKSGRWILKVVIKEFLSLKIARSKEADDLKFKLRSKVTSWMTKPPDEIVKASLEYYSGYLLPGSYEAHLFCDGKLRHVWTVDISHL